jgi:CDP-diacylglycerol--glycerol-3-phosphate 3-phosphatidyltransferase
MNMPNKLTLTRIILAPVFMTFFLSENPYSRLFGCLLYFIAALTDIADGHYARKYGIVTGFGKFMDPLADKILVTSAFIALVSLHYVRAWMVMLIVSREFFVTGLRMLAAYKGRVISPTPLAKGKTIMQMTTITIILIVITLDVLLKGLQSPLATLIDFNWQLTFDILMGATTFITLYTGVDYMIKYYSLMKSSL